MRRDAPPVLWQGFVAGLVGYAVVALVFAVANVIAGRSLFYTAALLGQALLGPTAAPDGGAVDPSSVLAYNGVHLVGFLVLGVAAAALVELLDRFPSLWLLTLFVFVAGFALQVGLVLLIAAPVAESISWESVLVANALAALGVGLVLAQWHGGLPGADASP